MMKCKNSITIISLLFLVIYSCKKEEKIDKKKHEIFNDQVLEEISYKVFNPNARRIRAMSLINESQFKITSKNRDRVEYLKEDSLIEAEIFKIEFNPKYNLVLESYRLKDGYVLRLQSKLKDSVYEKKHLFPLLLSPNSGKLLNFIEFEDLCKEYKLFTNKDTLFYGYKLDKGTFEVNKPGNQIIDGFPTRDLEEDPFQPMKRE